MNRSLNFLLLIFAPSAQSLANPPTHPIWWSAKLAPTLLKTEWTNRTTSLFVERCKESPLLISEIPHPCLEKCHALQSASWWKSNKILWDDVDRFSYCSNTTSWVIDFNAGISPLQQSLDQGYYTSILGLVCAAHPRTNLRRFPTPVWRKYLLWVESILQNTGKLQDLPISPHSGTPEGNPWLSWLLWLKYKQDIHCLFIINTVEHLLTIIVYLLDYHTPLRIVASRTTPTVSQISKKLWVNSNLALS